MKTTFGLLFLLPTTLFADEVFIKGAGSITGRIVEQTDAMVTVDIGGGVISVSMAHVARIVRGRTDLDEYDTRANRLRHNDLHGWRELARWASRHGLAEPAGRAFEQVLAIDPDDPEARAALGFALLDGRWVAQEEAYRSRGFVKYEGEWLMPAEAQMRRESAAAEQASQEAERSARAAELENLKAEVQAAYEAEAAADAEWQAEGAEWFYSRTYNYGWHGCGYGNGSGYGYGSGFHRDSWRYR
jgi:hypothetical protein